MAEPDSAGSAPEQPTSDDRRLTNSPPVTIGRSPESDRSAPAAATCGQTVNGEQNIHAINQSTGLSVGPDQTVGQSTVVRRHISETPTRRPVMMSDVFAVMPNQVSAAGSASVNYEHACFGSAQFSYL